MKELSCHEIEQVSGGIGFTFFLAVLSGATGGSRANTTILDGMWWGTVGFVAGLPFMGVGALVLGPLGFMGGVIEGFAGHVIGSLFHNEPKVIYVQQPVNQNIN
ncbi:MAG: hypothetical protein JSR17_00610 [Proteobacteria bacterium]|nr:hypothetical protein [Pseudomonadota bacterium]